jgi:hypothetical protein
VFTHLCRDVGVHFDGQHQVAANCIAQKLFGLWQEGARGGERGGACEWDKVG